MRLLNEEIVNVRFYNATLLIYISYPSRVHFCNSLLLASLEILLRSSGVVWVSANRP